ncbi:MAG: hypothetical protein QNJ55_13100 [Xenococcus sp. MO_188.B8]|nr:hypothetical protein [Xenococcus sp. MO_188.B8]
MLPVALQAIAFRLLEKAKAIEVYEDLQFDVQQFLLEKFQAEEAQQIIESIAPDERVKLFDELPPGEQKKVWKLKNKNVLSNE